MLSFFCLMERLENYEDKVAVALIAFCTSATMIAEIVDPGSLAQAKGLGVFALVGVYVFVHADPAIVANFYGNFFKIAWNSIL